MDYFAEQWLDNQFLPHDVWNCFERRHRTTNCVEGWHSRLNATIGRSHPRVKNLIKALKSEAESASLAIARHELNLEGTKRKKKYSELDERIERSTNKYIADGNVTKFLEIMSYVLMLD